MLNQINSSNVSRLGLAWSADIPASAGQSAGNRQEGTPLVFNGVLYSITPWSVVYAVDARTRERDLALRPRSKPAGLAIAHLLRRRQSRHRASIKAT